MRIIVCGSRKWPSHAYPVLRQKIAAWLETLPPDAVIVHPGTRGAAMIAREEAEKMGFTVEPPWLPDWREWGDQAGPVRSEWLARMGADLCVAWWDGKSTGTADMIARARNHDIHTEVVIP